MPPAVGLRPRPPSGQKRTDRGQSTDPRRRGALRDPEDGRVDASDSFASRVKAERNENLPIPSPLSCPYLSRSGWVASLHKESSDIPVEYRSVVVPTGAECHEVLGGDGHRVAENLELHVTVVGVDGHSHDGGHIHVFPRRTNTRTGRS